MGLVCLDNQPCYAHFDFSNLVPLKIVILIQLNQGGVSQRVIKVDLKSHVNSKRIQYLTLNLIDRLPNSASPDHDLTIEVMRNIQHATRNLSATLSQLNSL